MKIVVHDYAGHASTVDLSRELARRGHQVLHLYCGSVVGPRGNLERSTDDPPGLMIEAVSIGAIFDKYSARRIWDEIRYGWKLATRVRQFAPRVVLSANAPLLSQRLLLAESRRSRRRFLYWWQDSYGVGIRQVLADRWPLVGRVVGGAAIWLERSMLRDSDRVIAIASSMASLAVDWGVDPSIVEVIPNWAPLQDAAHPDKRTAGHDDADADPLPLVLYAGTLGLKHDPDLLLELARALEGEARVLVVSEGPGRVALEDAKTREALRDLELADYLPVAELRSALARAAVLIVLLREAAGTFSVPSKVLTYLAAGRPIVGALPATNAAAEVLRSSGAGVVVAPDDIPAFVAAVRRYLRDPEAAAEAGAAGLRYAEEHFVIGPIVDRFETMMTQARRPSRTERRVPRIAYDTVGRVWRHPSNRGRRPRALWRYFGWQLWQRLARRPIDIEIGNGRLIRCHPHSPVTSAVIYFGLPDHAEMRFVQDYLRAGDVFIDVGAHEGVYSLIATTNPDVRAVSVEPSSATFERLEENVALNHAEDQIHPVRRAIGLHTGRVLLTVGRDAMNTVLSSAPEGVASEDVAASTLDELAAELVEGPIAMIKVDVEGAELAVLESASATIAAHRPVLIVEVNDPDRITEFARSAGYVAVSYDPDRRMVEPTSTYDHDGYNLLLVPDLAVVAARLAT